LVDRCFARRHGFGIGAATVEPALRALGLRQYFVDLFDQGNLHHGILPLGWSCDTFTHDQKNNFVF
jgi:hypothetical protein